MTYEECRQRIREALQIEKSFDLVERVLQMGKQELTFIFVDGLIKDDVMEEIMSFLLAKGKACEDVQQFLKSSLPYVEAEQTTELMAMTSGVLSGAILLLAAGCDAAILLDARTYPVRSMVEPEDERTLRGSRDGFVETLVFNTALVRRRIRDEKLRMEYHSVGKCSRTDMALCYMEGIADEKILDDLREKLAQINVDALTMAQESIAEVLVPHAWWNPLPKVRYTERPDTAASCILEGSILLLVDTSPSALILPTAFFDFIQEAQDYYLPPITGNYLRIVRILVFFASLLITPLWYHFLKNPSQMPPFLAFVQLTDHGELPILLQLLLLEVGIDALKLASLNTPSSLNNSFSIIGALILGDFAVGAGWLVPQAILYMAFVALANFTQASYELGYAVKFMRIFLLLCIALIPGIGLYVGSGLLLVMMSRCTTLTDTSYFYPLFPFHLQQLKKLLIRKKLKNEK